MIKELPLEARLYFRDELRKAIAIAQHDAEGFQEILFTIEKLGVTVTGKISTLGTYQKALSQFVDEASPREAVAIKLKQWHLPFNELFDIVRDARNDALHSGTVARHLTKNVIRLALILEEALMDGAIYVRELMVRDPTCAFLWQPVSLARQQMLANGFTNLPIYDKTENPPRWKLLTDYQVAKYLRSKPNAKKILLAKTIEQAILSDELVLLTAETCSQSSLVSDLIPGYSYLPILVIDDIDPDKLIGILTPFDLL
jgi:CBS domain-containing protein